MARLAHADREAELAPADRGEEPLPLVLGAEPVDDRTGLAVGHPVVADGGAVAQEILDDDEPVDRAPVVTQMVWYKVGAADEPPGVSGIAHFLEHMIFNGTIQLDLQQL